MGLSICAARKYNTGERGRSASYGRTSPRAHLVRSTGKANTVISVPKSQQTTKSTHHARAVALMDAYRATLPRDPDLLECATCGRDVPSDLEQVFDVVLCERCQGEDDAEQTGLYWAVVSEGRGLR